MRLMNCFDRSSKEKGNDEIDASTTPHFSFGNVLEKEFFCEKTFGFALKPFRVWHLTTTKWENAATRDVVDKSLYEERRPRSIYYGLIRALLLTSKFNAMKNATQASGG